MTPTEGSRVDPLLGAWSKLVLDPASRTYWGSLLAAALIAAALAAWIHLRGSQRPLGTCLLYTSDAADE